MCVNLAFQVERASFICDITRNNQENKRDPEKERVDCQKRSVVHEDTRPSNERSDNSYASSQSGYNQLGAITNTDNVRMVPNVEAG